MQSQDKGASSWVNVRNVIPLEDEGFNVNKEEFFDSLRIRYNLPLPLLPVTCVRRVTTVVNALAIFGDIWRYLAIFGDIWRYLAIFGDIWRYLAIFGDIWRYLAIFGDIWRYLAIFGDIWRYLAIFGDIWRYLAPSV